VKPAGVATGNAVVAGGVDSWIAVGRFFMHAA
jgi:hypothetical protein